MLDSTAKAVAIVNWDGILAPRSASRHQLLMALYSFAELYTYRWQPWILALPVGMQPRTRAALALAYLPQVLALYNSRSMSQLIQQFKLGQISETDFFQTVLDRHFAFLKHVPNLPKAPIELIGNAWCYPRLQPMSELERARLDCLLRDFQQVIFIANSNTADIGAFIKNLLHDPQVGALFPNALEILRQLPQYKANSNSEALSNLFRLSQQLAILTSAQTGHFKVEGNPRRMPAGFLADLLGAYKNANITVISNLPSDLSAALAVAPNCVSLTSDKFFHDRTTGQKIKVSLKDNSPLLIMFLFVIALLYCFFYLTSL